MDRPRLIHKTVYCLLSGLVLLLCLFAARVLLPRESRASVSPTKYVWVDVLCTGPWQDETLKQVERIGPSAIPYIIKRLREQFSPFQSERFWLWSRLPLELARRVGAPQPRDVHKQEAMILALG